MRDHKKKLRHDLISTSSCEIMSMKYIQKVTVIMLVRDQKSKEHVRASFS